MPPNEFISLRELDRLMRRIPNFAPRGYGIIIYKHEYSASDCDCRDCIYYPGRARTERCASACNYTGERIKTELMTYETLLLSTMNNIHYEPFIKRLEQYLYERERILPMNYRNEKHRQTFEEATKKLDDTDYAALSAVYLLTADGKLWSEGKKCLVKNNFKIVELRPKSVTENGYTLMCAAKDLCMGTKYISVKDLADADLISPELFGLICNAMAIRRFGVESITHND